LSEFSIQLKQFRIFKTFKTFRKLCELSENSENSALWKNGKRGEKSEATVLQARADGEATVLRGVRRGMSPFFYANVDEQCNTYLPLSK
jgi:hypothetical protein